MIDWKDPRQVQAYKSGWEAGKRHGLFRPRPGITELAYQCMLNEFERARRPYTLRTRRKKKPNSEGTREWKQLSEAKQR